MDLATASIKKYGSDAQRSFAENPPTLISSLHITYTVYRPNDCLGKLQPLPGSFAVLDSGERSSDIVKIGKDPGNPDPLAIADRSEYCGLDPWGGLTGF